MSEVQADIHFIKLYDTADRLLNHPLVIAFYYSNTKQWDFKITSNHFHQEKT